jgi:hypothetical protein
MRRLSILSCVRLFLLGSVAVSLAISGVDAASEISVAEYRVKVCYEAAADAAQAGANVTHLLEVLDDAGTLLSKAQLVYKTDPYGAQQLARQCQQKLNGFEAQASSLGDAASNQHYWDFTVNVVGSIVGAFAVIACSFVVWTMLKRRSGKT